MRATIFSSETETLDNKVYSTENNTFYWYHNILFLASLAVSYQAVQFLIYGIFILITTLSNFFSPKRLIKRINSHMKLWFGILVQYCTLLSPDLHGFFTYLLEGTRQCLPIYLEDFMHHLVLFKYLFNKINFTKLKTTMS